MKPVYLILLVGTYFALIFLVSYLTGRKANNDTFFIGNRRSPWYIVSIGMIGASISGVTFISVPGWVGSGQFAYVQMILGFIAGYIIIANVLLPLYYKLNLTSIYTYLDHRFGNTTYKTGAWCFLVSRTAGSAFRLFLMANVLQITIFNHYNIPFFVTVAVTILLIWLYTFKGGIRTVIYTDMLQAILMLGAVILTVIIISRQMDLTGIGLIKKISGSDYSRIFFFDHFSSNKNHFIKQFLAGVFITIVMTGLDQDMMQKNLSCRSLHDAKKNMYWYGFAFLPINILFLSLGTLLFMYAAFKGIALPQNSDDLFPLIATGGYLQPLVTILFMLGLIAAAYSSADSALTALTTSVTIDIFNGKRLEEEKLKKLRMRVHIAMSIVLLIIILLFKALNNDNIISAVYKWAGYTYGPLLGIFAFGLFTKWNIKNKYIPIVALLSPVICFILNKYSTELLGYTFGFELLILNGLLTFIGLLILVRKK